MRSKKKIYFYLIISLVLVLGAFGWQRFQRRNSRPLEVNFLDVGQGDAILLSDQNSNQILIDGGPNGRDLLYQLGKTMPWLDKKIELVILTHPDADHLTGLIDLVESYQVERFLTNGETADNPVFAELLEKLERWQIEPMALQAGDKIKLGAAEFSVLNSGGGEAENDRNEASVVMKMVYGKNSFLFMGDAERVTESRLVLSDASLEADWLKVGHHGSGHGTGNFFLEQVRPQHAVISAGENNRYGHPATKVLQRLEERQTKIWRTDQQGTISVGCDLESCRVRTEK